MRRTILISLALLAAACGGDDESLFSEPSGPTVPTTDDTGATTSGGATVELLDAGAAPRRELRLTPEIGTVERVTIRQEQHQEIDVEGTSATVDVVTEIDATYNIESADDSSFTAAFEIDDARLLNASDPQSERMLTSMMDSMVGNRGTTRFDRRGQILETDASLADIEMPAVARDVAESVTSQVDAVAVPLPAEPVGVGARWRVISTLDMDDLLADTRQTVTLRESSDETVVADVEAELSYRSQSAQIDIVETDIAGGGTMEWSLSGLSVANDMTLEGDFVVESVNGRISQYLLMRTTVSVIEP